MGVWVWFGSPFTFTGELLDANALLYLRARYYSPALGVFTGLDPVENLNRYQYVGANPTNWVDLSGRQTQCHRRKFQQRHEAEIGHCPRAHS